MIAVLDDGVDVDHPNLKPNIKRKPDRDYDDHDGDDQAHVVEFAAEVQQMPDAEISGNNEDYLGGHEGTPGERPSQLQALCHRGHHRGQ